MYIPIPITYMLSNQSKTILAIQVTAGDWIDSHAEHENYRRLANDYK